MCCVYRINSVSILLDCYIICTLAKSRDRAGSGTGPGTSFPFKTSEGKMPSALEAIPTGLIKELMMASISFGGVLIGHVQKDLKQWE